MAQSKRFAFFMILSTALSISPKLLFAQDRTIWHFNRNMGYELGSLDSLSNATQATIQNEVVLINSGSGDWNNLTTMKGIPFYVNRDFDSTINFTWKLRFLTDPSTQSWRENNKVWISLIGEGGTRYTLLFKPNRAQDFYISFQFQLIETTPTGDRILMERNTHLLTPHQTWINFRWELLPASQGFEQRIYFDNGNMANIVTVFGVPASGIKILRNVGLQYKTGSGPLICHMAFNDFRLTAAKPLLGFVGDGDRFMANKSRALSYVTIGNHQAGNTVIQNLMPATDPNYQAGQTVVRRIALLNFRNDGLGFTTENFRHQLERYGKAAFDYYVNLFAWDAADFHWWRPNIKALIAVDSSQIKATLLRDIQNGASGRNIWEIGNEPNWWVTLTPEDYADLWVSYATFIKKIDPNAKITLGPLFASEFIFDLAYANDALSQKMLQNALDTKGSGVLGFSAANLLKGIGAVGAVLVIGGAISAIPGLWVVGAVVVLFVGWSDYNAKRAVRDTKNVVLSRIKWYDAKSENYLNKVLDRIKSNHPTIKKIDAISVHIYPFDYPTIKTDAIIQAKINAYLYQMNQVVSLFNNSKRENEPFPYEYFKSAPEIYVTEFGNINPKFNETTATNRIKLVTETILSNRYTTGAFAYKPVGFDKQLVDMGLVSEAPFTRMLNEGTNLSVLADSSNIPNRDPFPCKVMNPLGNWMYQRINNNTCEDIFSW